jgi:hypothetical protein
MFHFALPTSFAHAHTYHNIPYSSGLEPGVREDMLGDMRERLNANQNETQKPLELWTSFDPRTDEDYPSNWGAGLPETSSVISLTS